MEETILGFPFEQIGDILRELSLSPMIVRLLFIKKKRLHAEDVLLVVLSGLLFGTLYRLPSEICMIRRTIRYQVLRIEGTEFA